MYLTKIFFLENQVFIYFQIYLSKLHICPFKSKWKIHIIYTMCSQTTKDFTL